MIALNLTDYYTMKESLILYNNSTYLLQKRWVVFRL